IARLRAEVAQRDQRVRNMQLVEADVRAEYLRFEQRALRAEAEVARLTAEVERGELALRYNVALCEKNDALRTCVTQLVKALRACGHDSGCHPSEDRHSDVCRAQPA